MSILNYIKKQWNLVFGIALLITAILSKFIIPPQFSNDILSQAIDVDYNALSKFIVTATLLILLIPSQIFNQKKHFLWWWILGIFSFIISIVLFFNYNNIKNEKSAYNRSLNRREVIGLHLMPTAKKTVDSVARIMKTDSVLPDLILDRMGSSEDNWPKEEIALNANKIITAYLFTVVSFSIFILFSIQALYCYNQKENTSM